MNTRFLLPLLLLLASGATRAEPFASAFTYQGELTVSGAPAQGAFDIEFALYDVASEGAAIDVQVVDDLAVVDGLFTAAIDFTEAPFEVGERYWIEVRVRDGASTGGFQQLLPRRELTVAPYALSARHVQPGGIDAAALGSGAISTSAPLAGDGTGGDPIRLPANALDAGFLVDEPGVTSTQSAAGFPVGESTAVQQIMQEAITVPAAGWVLVTAQGTLSFDHGSEGQRLQVGLSDTLGEIEALVETQLPPDAAVGVHRVPFFVQQLFPVAGPGLQLYRLSVRNEYFGAASAGIQVLGPGMTAVYLPSEY